MLVAVFVTALGVFAVGLLTQLFGYRTGGTIAIPVLAVYTLKNFWMLPIFLFSTTVAYIGLWIVKQRTLIYGRDELLVAMGIGSGIPLALLLGLWQALPESLRSVAFIGSILPGLAAYNYHQIKPEYRRQDLIATGLLLVVLVGIGWRLVSSDYLTSLSTLTPPVLYSAQADVALYKGLDVVEPLEPTILARPITVGIFLIGIALAERIRSRYGVRTGLIAMALLAIYALADPWLLVLYVLTLGLAYLGLRLVHHVTLFYGRVLISAATVTALVSVVPLVVLLPIDRGLSAYFIAILAGVNAYSWHVTAPTQRHLFVPLQTGAFLFLLGLMQAISLYRPGLLPQVLSPMATGLCLAGAVGCMIYAERRIVTPPDQEDIFAASILSGEQEL